MFENNMAYLPLVEKTQAEIDIAKKAIEKNIYGSGGAGMQLNPEFARKNLLLFGLIPPADYISLHNRMKALEQISMLVRLESTNEVEKKSDVLNRALKERYSDFVSMLEYIVDRLQSGGASTVQNLRNVSAKDYKTLDNLYIKIDADKIVDFLARIDGRFLGIADNGWFTIRLPAYMMENDYGIKACFKHIIEFRIVKADSVFKLDIESIKVKCEDDSLWLYQELNDDGDDFNNEEQHNGPHISDGSKVCMGANLTRIKNAIERQEIGSAFSFLLNSLDLYNEDSPYRCIDSGIGTFCDITGKWTRCVICCSSKYGRVFVNPCLNDGEGFVEATSKFNLAENKTSHNFLSDIPADGIRFIGAETMGSFTGVRAVSRSKTTVDVEKLKEHISRRVSWHGAIKRIGTPKTGEYFIRTTADTDIAYATSSWLSGKAQENGRSIRKQGNGYGDASQGLKIILKDNWFDIAFHELAARSMEVLAKDNALFGRTSMPPYEAFNENSFEIVSVEEVQSSSAKAAELLAAMKDARVARKPTVATVSPPQEFISAQIPLAEFQARVEAALRIDDGIIDTRDDGVIEVHEETPAPATLPVQEETPF